MKKKVTIEYGNTKIDGILEFNANAILVSTIINIICILYNDKEFVNVYVKDKPVMLFNKSFDSKIKIDLLEELITNAINKVELDECMIPYVKIINDLYNTKVKEIKDEIPIYKAVEHGANVDCRSEVPDTKCEHRSPIRRVGDIDSLSGLNGDTIR